MMIEAFQTNLDFQQRLLVQVWFYVYWLIAQIIFYSNCTARFSELTEQLPNCQFLKYFPHLYVYFIVLYPKYV